MLLATKNFKMDLRRIVFSLILLCVNSLSLPAQDLSLTPAKAELISQKTEKGEGTTTSQYIYRSGLSKGEILKFYRQMFANQGFNEMPVEPPLPDSRKPAFFFSKQKEGLILVLNFSGLSRAGSPAYSIITHNFSFQAE